MKTHVICFVLCQSFVFSESQNNVGTFSIFSHFNPKTQTFPVGTNTQLSQTFSPNQDTFFQSPGTGLDSLVHGDVFGATGFDGHLNTGVNENDFLDPSLLPKGSFDVFSSATGACDSFCQNAKRLEDQSLDQFHKDLKNFEAQFGNSHSNTNFIQNHRESGAPVLVKNGNSPSTFTQFRPNSVDNPQPVTPSSQPTFTKPKVTPFTIFNRPSTTTARTSLPSRRQTTKMSMSKKSTIKATIRPATSTTEKEENKNSNGVSIPSKSTTRKSTGIKFTFNKKSVGSSKSVEKGEDLPISTFFNEDGGGNLEETRAEHIDNKKTSDFPVFDAVPK